MVLGPTVPVEEGRAAHSRASASSSFMRMRRSATFTWLAPDVRLEDQVKLEEPGEQE